jgi:MFS superfamily sulfate permease-like transporter
MYPYPYPFAPAEAQSQLEAVLTAVLLVPIILGVVLAVMWAAVDAAHRTSSRKQAFLAQSRARRSQGRPSTQDYPVVARGTVSRPPTTESKQPMQ